MFENKARIMLIILLLLFFSISCERIKDPFSSNQYFLEDINFQEQLEADIAHMVLKSDGTVWAWGNNWTGQLGNGTLQSNSTPSKVKDLKNVVAIKLYGGIAVAADNSGDIWFWGDRVIWLESPELDTIITIPKKISRLKGTVTIEIRAGDIDLLRNDGTVWRLEWDHNSPTRFIQPKKVPGLNDIKTISGHLALKKDGTICLLDDDWIPPEWGGYIQGINNVIAIQNRWKTHTIVLKDDGTVWSWGKNSAGTLGNGTFDDSNVPVQIMNLQDIIAISSSGARCLALKNDGTVWLWGLIELNLDEDIHVCQNIPLKINNLDNVTIIHTGAAVESIVKKNDDSKSQISIQKKPTQKF